MPDRSPGCSFVWTPRLREVRDLRLYIEAECRNQGYGHLIVSFVKAFYFPFVSTADGTEQGVLQLPLAGAGGKASCMSVLPVTTQSRKFYRNQGFAPEKLQSKWLFRAPEVQALYSKSSNNCTFGLIYGAGSDFP